jgi:Glycerol uptake facilitator and related permeases (Major Intrinsic Protein Family)
MPPEARRPLPPDLAQKLAAEALGTGLLVATVVGSGIMAERLSDDAAVALLANAIPTGAILFVLVTVLRPVSGAHLNPAVTLVFGLQRALPPAAALLYGLAQTAGAAAGTVLAHLMFEAPAIALGSQARTGAAQWLSEGVATFGLVATILVGLRTAPRAIPALVGGYIVAAYWFTASTAFANPAVTLARSLTATFSGIRPLDVPAFIAAQSAGALLALGLCRWLLARKSPA